MPLIRGANVTFTSGNDRCLDFVTDGTHIYCSSAPPSVAGRVVKTAISPFAQTAVATLSKENPIGCTVLGGFAFTTHSDLPISDANSGLVIKTDTSTMLETATTQLWSPGPGSRRQSCAIYNDGTFLYVGSSAYSPTVGVWVNTKATQMDTSFGSQTEVTLPTKGTTFTPHVVDGDGSSVYFGVDSGDGVIEAFNTVVKLSTSPFAYVSKFEIPYTVGSWTGFCSVAPKLYVGVQPQIGLSPNFDAPGWVYRINTADMTLDGVVITQNSGVGGILCANGLLYVSSLSGGTMCVYDLGTYDRVGTIQFTGAAGGGGSEPTVGVFGPNTNGTVLYWGLYGTSPGGIQEVKNVYTGGASSTYPQTQQPTVATSGLPGPNSPNIPTTRKDISARTGQTGGGGSNTGGNNPPGSTSTGITSTNPILQASAMGDPHFYGFEGESWFFNGVPGNYYNLFSDEGIQINSLFRHWETSGGANFTSMEEIGITIVINKIPKIKKNQRKLFSNINRTDESIAIKITANSGVSVNGEKVCDSLDPILEFIEDVKEYFTDAEIDKFHRTEGYGVFLKANIIRFWPYHFIITQSTDGVNAPYLNIIARLDGEAANRPHGIIGQTADFDGKPKAHWDGEEADYKVSDLWSNDFKFNKFRG